MADATHSFAPKHAAAPGASSRGPEGRSTHQAKARRKATGPPVLRAIPLGARPPAFPSHNPISAPPRKKCKIFLDFFLTGL